MLTQTLLGGIIYYIVHAQYFFYKNLGEKLKSETLLGPDVLDKGWQACTTDPTAYRGVVGVMALKDTHALIWNL